HEQARLRERQRTAGLLNFKRRDGGQTTQQIERECAEKHRTETQSRCEQDFEERDQVQKNPVAIFLHLQKLYGGKEDDQVCERRNAQTLGRFANGFLVMPVEVKQRDREQHDGEAVTFRQLPLRVLE